jgi:hypothetical protein
MGAVVGQIASPLLKMILTQFAGNALANAFGSGETPLSKSIGQTQRLGQNYMPELYNQAMGKPSAFTNAAQSNLGQEINRMQQSYSASQQRANPSMISPTTPVREGQKNYQEAKVRGMADIMSQAQQAAQGQLMNAFQNSNYYQQQIEMGQRKDQQDAYSGLAGLWSDYKGLQNDAEFKAQFGPYIQQLYGIIKGLFGGQQGLMQPSSRAGGLGDFPNPRSDQDITWS